MSVDQGKVLARGRHWLRNGILIVLVLLVFVFSVLPLGIRWGLSHWFAEQGVKAELNHLTIAPLAGRIELAGLRGERDGERVFSLEPAPPRGDTR